MYSSHSKIKTIFIVAAAGIGKRMQLTYPKQFFEYEGKPLFMWPVMSADNDSDVDMILIVTNKENIDRVKETCEINNTKKVYKIIEGGSERQYSIYNAIKEIKNIAGIDDETIVFVQDGVRPFLKSKYIKSILNDLRNEKDIDGVVISQQVKDTIKEIDERGCVKTTLNRSALAAANTPQAFRWPILKKANDKANEDGYLGTDDSSLVERIGGKIKIIYGDADNVKITVPEDLEYLKNK